MAAKHMVVCVRCGRQFDANRGGYYNSSIRRYTCKSCGSAVKAQTRAAQASVRNAQADARKAQTGMRQSIGAMIGKYVGAGALAIFAVSYLFSGDYGVAIFTFWLAIGCFLWGFLPYYLAKKKKAAAAAAVSQAAVAAANAPKVCKSCGATTKGKFCEFCGSSLE